MKRHKVKSQDQYVYVEDFQSLVILDSKDFAFGPTVG